MKKLFFIFIITLSSSIFANEYDYYNLINNCIYESIEVKYINKFDAYIVPKVIRHWDGNDKDRISINIYFNAGVYNLNNQINYIIETKLINDLLNIFQDYDISITTIYPYNIIFKNEINYDLEYRQNIINDIRNNTSGILVDQIFNNSIYGYFYDKYFSNLPEAENRVNLIYYNNFNIFLEIILKYFGIGNIVNF